MEVNLLVSDAEKALFRLAVKALNEGSQRCAEAFMRAYTAYEVDFKVQFPTIRFERGVEDAIGSLLFRRLKELLDGYPSNPSNPSKRLTRLPKVVVRAANFVVDMLDDIEENPDDDGEFRPWEAESLRMKLYARHWAGDLTREMLGGFICGFLELGQYSDSDSDSDSESEAPAHDVQCMVCYNDLAADAKMYCAGPCLHAPLCPECLGNLRVQRAKCPMCREELRPLRISKGDLKRVFLC